ncbi:MAG: DNA-protecting protein DprA [Bacteroidales bacterium]|nr:DNA-protecting protein DprA [Bacteroidales bacterium]
MENFNEEERACLCALNRIFGFEPKIGRSLIEAFGGASAVFKASQNELSELLGSYSRIRFLPLITESAFESAAIELEKLVSDGCRFIGIGESGYPKALLECDDPPLGLYYKGILPPEEVFDKRPQIAIIGTRSLSYYGRDWCRNIVEAMSKAKVKPLIVSGLALGVDVTAHRAALDFGLPTVGVMATGIDDIYPPQNIKTGQLMAATKGCALITDYPPQTAAVRINFLRRNRIIAGICSATILVESKIRGGGMMTARLANSYDRDVFALPGRVDDPLSQGCNMLIRETIAAPIGNLSDLMERLGLGAAGIDLKADFKKEVEEYYADMDETSRRDIIKLALAVKSRRGIGMDDLCSLFGWTFSKVSRIVTTLECDGFISVDLLQHCSPRVAKS